MKPKIKPTIVTYYHQPSDEYFIEVTSINVNGKPVEFSRSLLTIDDNGFGGTRLSAIMPYTTLETPIYTVFIEAFVNESAAINLIMTEPVRPFNVCFAANDVYTTPLGPSFLAIDLVMQNEDVFWRISGGNSMVRIAGKDDDGDVWCLGFINGGEKPRSAVVIGGRQMEDNLLQFDLVSMRLGRCWSDYEDEQKQTISRSVFKVCFSLISRFVNAGEDLYLYRFPDATSQGRTP